MNYKNAVARGAALPARIDPQDPRAVAVDDLSDTYLAYVAKLAELAALEKEVERLRRKFEERLGNREVALIDNEPVITWQYVNKIRGSELKKDNPKLYDEYTRPVVVDQFDAEAFRKDHPALYHMYQSRQFRLVNRK